MQTVLQSLVTFIEDYHNYEEFKGDISFLLFYSQVLFYSLKIGKNQETYFKIINEYLQRNEVLIYEYLKKALQVG